MDISIVIPCFNEAENAANMQANLFPVVRDLARQRDVELIIVDDGSSDGTPEIFRQLLATLTRPRLSGRVVSHDRNRGLGAALRTGFREARGDIVITTDCDATYRFEEIPALLNCLQDDVHMVTGSQYHPSGRVANVPMHRLLLSQGSSFIYRLIVTKRLWTYTSLFRAYRRVVLDTVPFHSDGFLAGTELLINAYMAGYRIVEYPTVLYGRVFGTSKAKLIRTIKAHLLFQLHVLAARLKLVPAPWRRAVVRANS